MVGATPMSTVCGVLNEFKRRGFFFSILVHAPHSYLVIVTPTIGSVIHADRWVGGGRASLADSPFVFLAGLHGASFSLFNTLSRCFYLNLVHGPFRPSGSEGEPGP